MLLVIDGICGHRDRQILSITGIGGTGWGSRARCRRRSRMPGSRSVCLWYRLKARLRACRRIGKAPCSMARGGVRGVARGRRSGTWMSIEGRSGAGAECCRTRSRHPCESRSTVFAPSMSWISIPAWCQSISHAPWRANTPRALRPSGNLPSLVERPGGGEYAPSQPPPLTWGRRMCPLPTSPTDVGEELMIEPAPGYSSSRKARAVSGSRVRAKSGMAARKVWP